MIGGLVVAAEYLLIRFSVCRRDQRAQPVEAALAPLLFAFPAWAVVATVATAMVVGDALRRNQLVKSAFNAGQWSLSAVRVAAEPQTISVEVGDDGPGPRLDELGFQLPPPEADRGRGLYIVRSVADHVSFVANGGGATVRAVRRLQRPIVLPEPRDVPSDEVARA